MDVSSWPKDNDQELGRAGENEEGPYKPRLDGSHLPEHTRPTWPLLDAEEGSGFPLAMAAKDVRNEGGKVRKGATQMFIRADTFPPLHAQTKCTSALPAFYIIRGHVHLRRAIINAHGAKNKLPQPTSLAVRCTARSTAPFLLRLTAISLTTKLLRPLLRSLAFEPSEFRESSAKLIRQLLYSNP